MESYLSLLQLISAQTFKTFSLNDEINLPAIDQAKLSEIIAACCDAQMNAGSDKAVFIHFMDEQKWPRRELQMLLNEWMSLVRSRPLQESIDQLPIAIRFSNPQLVSPELDAWTKDAFKLSGMGWYANIYLSPANRNSGLGWHHDYQDTVVQQVFGAKEWQLAKTASNPGLGKYEFKRYVNQADADLITSWEPFSVRTEVADCLYIPYALPHSARTSSQASVHITYASLERACVSDQLSFFQNTIRQRCLTAGIDGAAPYETIAPAELTSLIERELALIDWQAEHARYQKQETIRNLRLVAEGIPASRAIPARQGGGDDQPIE